MKIKSCLKIIDIYDRRCDREKRKEKRRWRQLESSSDANTYLHQSSTDQKLQLSTTELYFDQYSTTEKTSESLEQSTSESLQYGNTNTPTTTLDKLSTNTLHDKSEGITTTDSSFIPTMTEYMSFITNSFITGNIDETISSELSTESTIDASAISMIYEEFTTIEPDRCIEADPIATGYVQSTRMTHISLFSSYDNSIYIINGVKNADTTDGINIIEKHDGFTGKLKAIYTCPSLETYSFMGASFIPTKNKILISGGIIIGQNLVSDRARLFDPVSGLIPSIRMSRNRASHTSIVSSVYKKVLLLSGADSPSTSDFGFTGDVFDGVKFRPVKNTLRQGRLYHVSTYLSSINKVLISGGILSGIGKAIATNTLELYDVATNTFQWIPVNMSCGRIYHTATYIPPPVDKVLILGGTNLSILITTYEIFDVKTLSITYIGNSDILYYIHTATLLSDQQSVLLVAGIDTNTTRLLFRCQIYNGVAETFTEALCPKTLRHTHTANLVGSTEFVYFCYGLNFSMSYLNDCELYKPTFLPTSTLA